MAAPEPIPVSLHGRVFTRSEALNAGVHPERLRRRDILRVNRGRYRWVGDRGRRPRSAPHPTAELEGIVREISPATADHRARAVLGAIPDAALSHTSAAAARGWWLPQRFVTEAQVHIARPPHRPPTSRPGVTTHRLALKPEDIAVIDGRRATSVERTWLDCAHLFSVDELTILGDSLVRTPYAWVEERRPAAWTTPGRLEEQLQRSTGVRGITVARKALSLIRVGSDSPKETELRLALIMAGLPEPQLQVQCWDPEYSAHFPATADLGYPQWRIAIHYEGRHHRSEEQLHRDIRREQAFVRQGWTNLRFDAVDAAQGFRTAVEQVRRVLSQSPSGVSARR
ncbi:hypothetical protein [Micrococcus terreus]|uniref:hypothetical protein n=1 Tax=Micrococcus terreus TaxID=574650 RepID=UPI0023F7B671|nr:hypothetical protein [Micrococcus terreus]